MDRELFNPPGIVRSVDVRAELAPKIRAVYRRTEEDRRQLGIWLNQCKDACVTAGDDWLAWLERETGISHDTATRWMNAVKKKRQEESDITHLRNGVPDESEIDDDAEEEEDYPSKAENGSNVNPSLPEKRPALGNMRGVHSLDPTQKKAQADRRAERDHLVNTADMHKQENKELREKNRQLSDENHRMNLEQIKLRSRLEKLEFDQRLIDITDMLKPSTVKSWFAQMSKRYHPDSGGTNEEWKVFHEAYIALVALLKK